ncbi:plectrovirus SVGII3 orf 2 transmembrane protein [Sesbania bispinosa]|nr:plectrovirus SVGII3 orf 2 transmembrane protein [Sesbania bispinosa]
MVYFRQRPRMLNNLGKKWCMLNKRNDTSSFFVLRRAVLDDVTLRDVCSFIITLRDVYTTLRDVSVLRRAVLDDVTLRDVCSFNANPPSGCAQRHHST